MSIAWGVKQKNHPLWEKFEEYAEGDCINLDNEVDWSPWWKCFLAGIRAGTVAANKKKEVSAVEDDEYEPPLGDMRTGAAGRGTVASRSSSTPSSCSTPPAGPARSCA